MPFLAKRPSLLVLKPAGSSSSSSSSSTSSFAVAGPSTSVPPPSDAAASSSSSSPPPLDTPGMTVSAAPALVPAARSSTSSSSAPSAAAVQQHRRLVDAWFSLHRFSKADLTEHISNLLQQRRYDELAIACRAIFADHPPTFTNERDPHAAFSSSQQADEAERKGEVEGWQDVDMREKPAKRRALVTKTITGLQQDEAVSERDVGECVEVIKGHLAELGSRYLVVLAYLLTQGVKQAKCCGRLFDLLPPVLSELRKHETVDTSTLRTSDASMPLSNNPAQFEAWLVESLVQLQWTLSGLVQLAPHLTDLQLGPDQNAALVSTICHRLREPHNLLCSDLPIVLLHLCSIRKVDKCRLLSSILGLFNQLDRRYCADDPAAAAAASKRQAAGLATLLTLEQTSLVCLQSAITQEPFLGGVLLHLVGSRQVPLTTFCLQLLLAMAHIRRHQEATLDFLHSFLVEQLQALAHQFDSYTLRDEVTHRLALYVQVGPLMLATVRNSQQLDLITPNLIELALRLLDTKTRPERGQLARISKITFETFQSNADLVMFTPHVNAVFIGSSVLYELFFLHPLAQSSILEQLCDRMIRNANPLPSILLLRRLVDKQPAAFAPHREKLLACIDHLINLPPDIALLFIRSIVRLLHTPSPHGDADETVRSRLLMVLKKLLFSAAPQARVLACDGVVVLIEAVLKGQLTGSGGDEGVGSLSQSSSQSSGPAVDLPLLMELLSLLRKVMSSSAGIKQLLYARLTALYASYSFSRQHILDLLLPSFRFIQTDAAVRIPFQLNLCVYQGVITEPLPELMLTIVQALCVSLSSVANPTAHQQLRSTFRHVIARMSTLTCKDMGFNPKAGIAADSDVTRLVLLHGLYQACMEYALCENLRGLDQVLDAAGVPRKEAKVKEEVSEEGWRTLKELFQRFSPLDNHLAGRKEKDEDGAGKKKKSTAAKKKRTQEEDSSSSVEESDDDGDGGEQKKGKGVKKKGGQPKGKGKEEGGVEKKKVAVSYLLSPLALNVCLRRLLMQEYREYPTQLLLKDVELQRFMLHGVGYQLERVRVVLLESPLESAVSIARDDLKRLIRCLAGYCARLHEAINKLLVDSRESEEAGKKSSHTPTTAVHELTRALAVAAQLGRPFLNDMCTVVVQHHRTYKEALKGLEDMYPECGVVAIHSAVQMLRDRTAQLVEYNRHREAQSYLALLSLLITHTLADATGFSLERRGECSLWASLLLEKEISHSSVVRGLLHLYTQVHDDRKQWTDMVRDLHVVCGYVDRSPSPHTTTLRRSIHEKSAVVVVMQLCSAMHCYLDDCDVLLQQMRQLSKAEEISEEKERWLLLSSSATGFADALYQRLLVVCELLNQLTRTALKGTAVDWVVRLLSRTFKLLTTVTKAVYRAGRNPPATFSQLCHFVVQNMATSTHTFVLHITGADKPEQGGVTDETMARIAREKRLVPELTYHQSTFDAIVLTLSSAAFCGANYAKGMTRSKARDFKLSRGVWVKDSTVQRRQRRRVADSDDDDSDLEDDEEDDEEREEDDDDFEEDEEEEEEDAGRARRGSQRSQASHTIKPSVRLHLTQKASGSQSAAASQKKRKRGGSSEEDDDEEEEQRPRKSGQTKKGRERGGGGGRRRSAEVEEDKEDEDEQYPPTLASAQSPDEERENVDPNPSTRKAARGNSKRSMPTEASDDTEDESED